MPVWWIVGVAIYIPLFICALVALVRKGEFEPGEAIMGGGAFIAASTASAFLWFG